MTARNIVKQFYNSLCAGNDAEALSLLDSNFSWDAAHPINNVPTSQALISDFWGPVRTALHGVERKVLVDVEGEDNGQSWVMATGYFIGAFNQPLFGIPATKKSLHLRFTEIIGVKDGKINVGQVIFDFIDAMNQAGVNPLRKSLGFDGLMMPPTRCEAPQDLVKEGQQTVQLIQDMLGELGTYDGKSLKSMDLAKYWDENFIWYGPAGVGTTRGIDGFRRQHQGPFLRGFPDRSVDFSTCYVGEGYYAATGGWPHMTATHTGPHWLGLPATGKEITLRVMDIWRRKDDKLVENWVGIDIIHILLQLGLDVFDVMTELLDAGNLTE